ncbi:hypothetical protein [Acidovorax sp. CF316]|uniref:hypothetical protein n=1 Tax=Acidovorax sp. CF316 TaxID=1144317 RepID=UPI001EE68C07|nr:hypothetical protein [Acidovorax sp. CF316]
MLPIDRSVVGKGDADLFANTHPLAWHGQRGNVFCVDFSAGGRWAERVLQLDDGVVQATQGCGALKPGWLAGWPQRFFSFFFSSVLRAQSLDADREEPGGRGQCGDAGAVFAQGQVGQAQHHGHPFAAAHEFIGVCEVPGADACEHEGEEQVQEPFEGVRGLGWGRVLCGLAFAFAHGIAQGEEEGSEQAEDDEDGECADEGGG